MDNKNKLWDDYVKYSYRSYKNEEALPWVIIGTIFCVVFCVFAPLIPLLWIWYASYCHKNNKTLMNDTTAEITRKIDKRESKIYIKEKQKHE